MFAGMEYDSTTAAGGTMTVWTNRNLYWYPSKIQNPQGNSPSLNETGMQIWSTPADPPNAILPIWWK